LKFAMRKMILKTTFLLTLGRDTRQTVWDIEVGETSEDDEERDLLELTSD
jgi:hypothetical protein